LAGQVSPVKRGVAPARVKAELYATQDGACNFCRKAISLRPCDFDVDHIVPVKFGGPACRSNLHLLCVTCHRAKSGFERSK
ncbi:unnamed protein product, partial [Ectocarpus sp. 6 AP-2014]